MNARADRFPLFDGLRAVAALSIVAFHAAFFVLSGGPLRKYTAHLDVGVTIFFLVSGFLLYRPFVRARMRDEPLPATGAYAWRRFLRIAPAYWVALTVVTIWLSLPDVFGSQAPLYYGFAQIYDAGAGLGGIAQAWTLCVEVSFYAFLPLWALLLRPLPGRGRPDVVALQELAGLALLFVLSVAYKVWALRQTSPIALDSGPYLQPLPNFLDQFSIGMGLAVLTVWSQSRGERPEPRVIAWLRRWPSAPFALALVAFWAVSTQIGLTGVLLPPSYPARTFLERHELYSLIALGVVAPAIFAAPGRGLAGRLLGNRVVLWLGLVSYSIYLYHLAVVRKLHEWIHVGGADELRLVFFFVVGAACSAAVAAVSYYLVERPALSLKRLVRGRGIESQPAEALVEPAPVAPATSPRG
ncbi:MAG TPA: acyltransferase [Thermoleophilaceae bacterium]|jgi:peptidoglycan/LPS O-acetylase OafA/YrhL